MHAFISYRTNAEPDRSLCDQLSAAFKSNGHEVFVDRQLEVGARWAEEIDRALESIDFLVLLLSEESSHSEMVLAEVKKAHEIARRKQGIPRILPVRVAFRGRLPYPLDSYVDPLQQLFWGGAPDTEATLQALLRVICGHGSVPPSQRTSSEPPGTELERPSAYAPVNHPLSTPGGALDADDPLYVRRDCDHEAQRVMERGPGQTITIKGPRQVGKSSLLMRILSRALAQERRVALVDFQLLVAAIQEESTLFKGFLCEILSQLDLPPLTETEWDVESTPAQCCTNLVDKLVLRRIQQPLTLACDETDLILSLQFRDNFFGMLRAWHGKRANPTLRQRWGKLDLVLVTSTEPYLFIDRPDQSPFNVGAVLRLEDFDRAQVAQLNTAHGSPLSNDEIEALMELTGGHPYLVRRAFYAVAARGQAVPWRTVAGLATDDHGPFGDHLRRHLLNVLRAPELRPVLSAVLAGQAVTDEVALHRLVGAGLVRRQGDRLLPRCSLYAQYFKGKL